MGITVVVLSWTSGGFLPQHPVLILMTVLTMTTSWWWLVSLILCQVMALSRSLETNLTFVDFNSNHVNKLGRTDPFLYAPAHIGLFNSTSRSQTFILIRTLINIMLLSLEELIQISKRIILFKLIKIFLLNFSPKKKSFLIFIIKNLILVNPFILFFN